MTQVPRYLTAVEVAERLQVTPETARDWARTGKVPAIQLPSGHYRFRAEDIDAIEQTPASSAA